MDLALCASCARHVKASEATCPFCLLPLVAAELAPTPLDKRRWHAVVMAIAATTGACGKTDAKPDVADIPMTAPPYGLPPDPTDAPPEPPEAGTPIPSRTIQIMAPRPPYGVPRNDRFLRDGGKRNPKDPFGEGF